MRYDSAQVAHFFDEFGDKEWRRPESSYAARATFHVHRHYVMRYVREGDLVFDAGAGPGRFTIELARLGARVFVGDISPYQLEQNQIRVAEAGCDDSIVDRDLVDIEDLSRFDDGHFDAVVCYGGPLSYMSDRAPQALAEMVRVTRPGGVLLLSVLSRLGAFRSNLPGIFMLAEDHGLDVVKAIKDDGDLPRDINQGHEYHAFTWAEFRRLLEGSGQTIEVASASNFLSPQNDLFLVSAGEDWWPTLLEWEVELTTEPGVIDAGSYIIGVLRKNS